MSKTIHSDDIPVGQASDIILKDGSLAVGGADLAAIDKPLESEYVKALAFMEEELDVVLNETEDPNAENPVTVGNNGVFKQFFRGVPTRAKRKFVDCLIAKSSRVTTPKGKNGAGEDTFLIRQTNAMKYPFSVMNDPNPKGRDWLMMRFSEIV